MSERRSRLPVKSSFGSRSTMTPTTSRLDVPSRGNSLSRGTVSSLSLYVRNKSPNRKKKIPFTNKDWQKHTLNNVRRFLVSIDPEIKLQPLSTPMFIYATNLLLQAKIDSTIELTKDTYQTELPLLLNIMEYPATISAATLKHPNIPHSLPAILGVWSYLMEVESITDFKNPYFDSCPEAKVLIDFCVNSLTDVDLQVDSLSEDLDKIYGIDTEKYARSGEEVERLKVENADKLKLNRELQDKLLDLQNQVTSMQKELDELEKHVSCYDEVMTSFQETDSELDDHLNRLIALSGAIKERLEENDFNNLPEFKKKIIEDQNTLSLLVEKRDYNMEKISKLDKDIVDMKRNVELSNYKINNLILDMGLEAEEVSVLTAPTSGLGRPDIIGEFKTVLDNWKHIMQRSQAEKGQIAKLEVENNQTELKLHMRESYLALLEDKELKIQEKSRVKSELIAKKILLAVNEYEGLRKSTEEISLYQDNLKTLKLELEELIKKNDRLVEECQGHYDDYSQILHNNIKDMKQFLANHTKKIKQDINNKLSLIEAFTDWQKAEKERIESCL